MNMRRNTLSIASWAALCALLLAVLTPTLSQVFAREARFITATICSASNAGRMQKILATEEAPAQEHAAVLDHCPFCHMGASLAALPTSAYELPVIPASSLRPSLFYQSSVPLFAWNAAKPRGPPQA
ncbi:hypothetical protein ACZ75_05615 [Massilia sp. NR 4-1]|nr:hypothetical protein ACZ75_05615 [Massilia sp. NR 4-1]